ncbi:MAG: hypothetical protein ACTSXA_13520 [Candidatus Heimdallarchaeota archaeon]
MNETTEPHNEEVIVNGVEIVDEESENLPDEIKIEQRSREIARWFNKSLGLVLIVLSVVIIVLVIISYFYHPGQPDATSLLLEQIIGYVLFGLGSLIGTISLLRARKLKEEPYIIEPVSSEADVDEAKIEEN